MAGRATPGSGSAADVGRSRVALRPLRSILEGLVPGREQESCALWNAGRVVILLAAGVQSIRLSGRDLADGLRS